MNSHSLPLRTFTILFPVVFIAGLAMPCARADQWDKKTILTVDQPIQVQERLLEPGQYVFKLLDSNSDRHIVQIFNGDQTQIIDTVLALPNYRLRPTGNSRFAFWETPPGSARALRAWFYPGDNFGQEFQYPKQLAMLTTAAATTPAPPPAPSAAVTPQPETPQATQPESMTQATQEEKQPEEMAQNAPPQTPEPQTPAPAMNEQATPKELPKSGSPYPLIGLSGLLSLGLYRLLRLSRSA
jgi:hypothetical protein